MSEQSTWKGKYLVYVTKPELKFVNRACGPWSIKIHHGRDDKSDMYELMRNGNHVKWFYNERLAELHAAEVEAWEKRPSNWKELVHLWEAGYDAG